MSIYEGSISGIGVGLNVRILELHQRQQLAPSRKEAVAIWRRLSWVGRISCERGYLRPSTGPGSLLLFPERVAGLQSCRLTISLSGRTR